MNKRHWHILHIILLSFLLLYLLYWRVQVSQVRFFDVDEFSYMHWTAAVARGEHMYTDFISYFTPGFMWVFSPVFWIVGRSAQVFTAARTLSFVIFLGILTSLGYLFGITRGWKWALLPVVILAFLPMPYDKFLEIRPDNLSTLFVLIGIIWEVQAIRIKKNWIWIITGLFYSASLFVLIKTLPVVAVGAGIALVSSPKKFVYFLAGLIVPWILFFSAHAVSGDFNVVWYSLTKLPFEVNKTAINYPMEANLFFYPNEQFYGGVGKVVTPGLLTNHIFWIAALLFGTYRLVTPTGGGKRKEMYIELLLAGALFVSVAAYVKFVPLKHSQYLIPIAVFVAYYASDLLTAILTRLERAGGVMSALVILLGFSYLLIVVTQDVNAPKLAFTHRGQLAELTIFLTTIPSDARVVDLEGRMVFWKDGYPISSLPFDALLPYVSRPPLSLARHLTLYPAMYIYEGDSNRFITLSPENITYIRAHYAPVQGLGGRLLKRL